MNDPLDRMTNLLTGLVLPNLKSIQISQTEQIAANDRLEQAIEELRLHMDSQFAHLSAQLTACRAELAAAMAAIKAARAQGHSGEPDRTNLVH